MMKQFPEIITFKLSSRCNDNCKYCYNCSGGRDLSLDELKEMFDLLKEKGVRSIVLTGGEPLIRNDFREVIKELKKRDFKIFLDTNAGFFDKYKKTILENVGVIGLPIDFPNKSYRNKENLSNVLETIKFLNENNFIGIIRIGTVVTQDNFDKLVDIGNLLKECKIDIWKVYEFIPQDINAKKNKKELEISQEKFDFVTKNLEKKFSDFFKVVISRRRDRTNAYFFVDSDGTVFMPIDDIVTCEKIVLGNIAEEDIVEKWERFVKEKNYLNNIKVTFEA